MRSVNLYYSSVFQDSNKPTLVQFRCKRTLSTSVSRCKLHKKNRNPEVQGTVTFRNLYILPWYTSMTLRQYCLNKTKGIVPSKLVFCCMH